MTKAFIQRLRGFVIRLGEPINAVPFLALSDAFQLGNHLFRNAFAAAARGGAGSPEAQLEAKLNMQLTELRLSVRAMNCLESETIITVRDLVQRTEDALLEVRNFGDTTLNEVREKLSQYGLHLGMRVPAQPMF